MSALCSPGQVRTDHCQSVILGISGGQQEIGRSLASFDRTGGYAGVRLTLWRSRHACLASLFSREPSNGLYRPQADYGRGVQILRIDDFSNDGDIVTTASNRVDAAKADRKRFGLAKDDIVLNRVNSLSHLGKTALIGDIDEPMVFESNMMRFRVDEERLRPAFAFRVLNSPVCKSQIIGLAKRAVAQSSVNQGDVGRLLIPLPPDLETQEEVLTILNAVEAKSVAHVQTRGSLNSLFRTLLHQLMTAQIRVHDLDLSALEEAAQEPAGGV